MKVQELEVKELQPKAPPKKSFEAEGHGEGGKVDLSIAGTSDAGVLVK